jgi:hypothetical protein
LGHPYPGGLDGLPDVDERVSDHERVLAAGPTAHRIGDAGLFGTGHQMIDEDAEAAARLRTKVRDDGGQIVDAAEVFDHHALDPQVFAPHLLHQFGVVPALDVDTARQCDFRTHTLDRDRTGRGACRRRGSRLPGRCQDDGLAVDQITGTDRKRFGTPVAVFEFHPAVLHAHHGTDETGLGVLDDHPDLDRLLSGSRPSGLVRVTGQDVGAIAISHRMSLPSPCVASPD